MELLKKIFLPITAPLSFIQNHFKAMIFLLIVALIFTPVSNEKLVPNNLQTISLVGPIFDATEVLEQIEQVEKDEKIKGVLLIVNSPGGAVAPSVEIAYAIKRLSQVKPVVAYAQGAFTSGSYYASIWANKIIANPGAIVGSIGVIMQGADLSQLLSTIGIKSQSVQAGKYKKVGTPDREWSEEEHAELEKVIHGTYEMFTQDVANARDLDFNNRESFADAHIFTASQAKDVGLVDSVGVLYDAKKEVETLADLKNPIWNKPDKIDQFLKKISASTASMLHTYFPALTLR